MSEYEYGLAKGVLVEGSSNQTNSQQQQSQQQPSPQQQRNQNSGISLDLTTPTAGNLYGGRNKG